jgi:acetolactate synthase-1/2/3 large subunit
MKLADALVTTLRDWGLEYLFGVSGANIEHLHDAVHRLGGERFRSVCAKSEVGAAFMADCRARVHRTLGVCCSTSGGGMMNLAVGVAEAFAESVPLLAVVGQPPTRLEGRGAFQDSSGIGRSVNAAGLWAAISKYQARITEPGQFWRCLDCAVTAAMSNSS